MLGNPGGGQMSQQSMNLRRATRIVKRYKRTVGGLVILGLVGGVCYAVVHPGNLSSSALVVLNQSVSSGTSGTNDTTGLEVSIQTDILIAQSEPVLSSALFKLGAAVSRDELQNAVSVTQAAPAALSINASAGTAGLAEKEANAVAESFVSYLESKDSPIGPVQAQILTPATSAIGKDLVRDLILFGVIGVVVGFIVGFVIVLRIDRDDSRLRDRDEIANSIGVPVIAALPARAPRDVGGWLSLLETYQPGPVHAWRLRAILDRMGLMQAGEDIQRGSSLTVLSLSSDVNALALGPQIATFVASLGIPTAFTVNAAHEAASVAALRAACATPNAPMRNGNLLLDPDGSVPGTGAAPRARLTVVTTVVGSGSDHLPGMTRATATVLGVAAGAASGEQLALAAAAAADAGTMIAGIIAVNPDPDDKTTGLVPRPVRPARRELPGKHANAREVRASDRTRPADWITQGSR